uniref:Uncharacterized protein n=1 Tax=Anopheles coluzzii TaxID=1518534 RepID=A0A8W7PJ04_ANOCL
MKRCVLFRSWASTGTWARSVSSSGISITSSFSLPDEPSDCSAASSSSCTWIVLTARVQALRLQHVQIRLEIARSGMGRVGHNAWPCLRMRPLRCRCRSLIIVRRRHVAMLRRQLIVRLLVVLEFCHAPIGVGSTDSQYVANDTKYCSSQDIGRTGFNGSPAPVYGLSRSEQMPW